MRIIINVPIPTCGPELYAVTSRNSSIKRFVVRDVRVSSTYCVFSRSVLSKDTKKKKKTTESFRFQFFFIRVSYFLCTVFFVYNEKNANVFVWKNPAIGRTPIISVRLYAQTKSYKLRFVHTHGAYVTRVWSTCARTRPLIHHSQSHVFHV